MHPQWKQVFLTLLIFKLFSGVNTKCSNNLLILLYNVEMVWINKAENEDENLAQDILHSSWLLTITGNEAGDSLNMPHYSNI